MQLMLGSLVRLVTALIARPAATITTLLYHSDLLPRNFHSERLERLVRQTSDIVLNLLLKNCNGNPGIFPCDNCAF
ncbi:hypothetical protein Pyn_22636 [Prunus yedoensis var. nudiflora]|uniref:Secreted protein n=1 Tax=Prunus yedoensis var. nudiflora TaxID=2094558 RepID=A0A314UCH5_PRUYE|nr:hypothetical protein Pyn_22636 [Prunus yedoensis var. nudiflora]